MERKRICFWGLLCALSFFFVLSASAESAHDFATVVRLAEPTCTEPGRQMQRCVICGLERTVEIPALGHEFSTEFTVDIAPSCGVTGQKSRHCIRCSAVRDITTMRSLDHEFIYSTVEPTCTQMGYRLRRCKNCKLEVKDQLVDPLGHVRGLWVETKAATCTATGVRSVSCTACGAVIEQKPIPVAEHRYTERVVAPTCTQSGYTLRTCTVCGAQSKTGTVKATGHSYAEQVVAPSCEEKGYTLRTCTRCGEQTKVNTVKALGHSYAAAGTQTKAPTCTEKGEESVSCSRCGARKTQSVPALGHNYDGTWTVDKAPICTAQGEQSHRCTRCGKRTDVTAIPRAEHSPVADSDTPPTCTAAGKTGGTHCAFCGKTLSASASVPALGHAFRESAVLKAATCTEQGSAERICSRCGKNETVSVPALGHNFSAEWTVDKAPTCTAQGEQSHRCTRCGKRSDVTAVAKTAHLEVTDPVADPTCTEAGRTAGAHCGLCGKVLTAQKEIPAPGHAFRPISEITAATCTEKGRALMACKVCGATEEQDVPALGHSFDGSWTVDTPPTCTAQGEQSHRCTRCGKRTDVTALPRTEHTVVYEGIVEPTCTKAGRADRAFCSVCGKELAEKTTIPSPGHRPETTVTPATSQKDGSTKTVCTVCGAELKTGAIPKIASVSLSVKKVSFSGRKILPEVKVKDSAGKTLKAGDNYKIKYASGCREIGTYAVKVVFCGNYSGSVTRRFQIVPRKVTGLDYSSAQDRITLTWKPVAGATGYKVYLFNEQTKRYTALKTTKKTQFSMQKLLPGTVYLLCVRAFTKQGDSVLAGALSNRKATATRPLLPEISAAVKNGKAALRWQNCGNCVYEIYAAEKKNGKYRLLGTTGKTSFVTQPFSPGGTQCFKVRALVRPGSGDLSRSNSKIAVVRF